MKRSKFRPVSRGFRPLRRRDPFASSSPVRPHAEPDDPNHDMSEWLTPEQVEEVKNVARAAGGSRDGEPD